MDGKRHPRSRKKTGYAGLPKTHENIEMLNKHNFDFYYLIICSRGPGSETITVSNVSNSRKDIHFMAESEAEFKQFGVCEAKAEFNQDSTFLNPLCRIP